MIDTVKIVPANESEREEGELCSDDEMLEDVSSGDNISTQITLFDDEKDMVKNQPYGFNNIRDEKAHPSAKWPTLQREMSLSEISDEECNTVIHKKRHRRSRIVSRQDTTDAASRQDTRKRPIPSIVVEKFTVTKNRGEKRPSKSSCHSTRKRKRKSFHKPLRSLSSNSIQVSSSESDVEVNYACKRKLSDAVHIDKTTTNNHLKVRLGSMLKKTTSGEDENKIKDNSTITFSIPQPVNKLVHVKNVPNNILDIEKTSIVPISDSSDEEPDVIRLRLLALQTKPKIVPSNTNKLSSENENKNNDSEEDQETQLRIDALKSAIIKKHLARKKRQQELLQIKSRRSSSEFSYSPSSPTSISSYDYRDSNLEDNDRPYSPSEPIETITESNNTNLFSPMESIKSEVVDDIDFNILGDRMTPIDMNIDNESNDDMEKDKVDNTESNQCIELIEPVKLKPVEINQTIKPNENNHHKVKDHPILGGWVPVMEPDNNNKKKKCKTIKTNLVHIISNSCKKNIKPNSGVFKKTLQPVENQVINNNPVLGNPISFNVNKPVICEQEKQLDNTGTNKGVEKKVDVETDAEEDEDILRAMLLTNLSTKIAKKSEPESNEIKTNIKNAPIVKKTYKENKLIGKNPKLNVKKRIMAPTCDTIVTTITKTVTNNKVINKNFIVKPPSTATTESEQRLLTMISKPVSKLVINVRASESDTDDEDPFKSKSVISDQVNNLPPIPEKEEVKSISTVSTIVINAGKEIVVNAAKDSTPVAVQQDPEFQKSLDILLRSARDQSRKEKPVPFSPSPVVDTKPVEVLSESRQEEYKRLKRKLHFLQKRNAERNAIARNLSKLAIAKQNFKEKLVETVISKPIAKVEDTTTTKTNIELPVIIINNDLCEQQNTPNEVPERNDIFSNSVIVQKANSINVTIRNDLLENNSETPDVPLLDANKVIQIDEENMRSINITIKNDFKPTTDVNKNIQIPSETTSDINKKRNHQYIIAKIKPLNESTQECAPKKCNANVNPDISRNHSFLSENEKKLVEGRYTFAKDLENMLNLISSAEKEKEIQTDLEKEIFALKEKLIKTEKKLEIQKFKTSSIYNKIGEYRKEIGKGRQACLTMSNTCNDLGTAVYGALYRTPTDGLELMKTKLQTLAEHTCRLRANNKDKSSVDLEIQEESLIDEILEEHNEIIDADNNTPEVTIQTNNTFEDNSINKVDMTTKNTSVILQNNYLLKSQESIISMEKPDEDRTSFHIPEYISPLLHMQSQSYSDPDAILCPYDLMGRCEDSSCKYQHIS